MLVSRYLEQSTPWIHPLRFLGSAFIVVALATPRGNAQEAVFQNLPALSTLEIDQIIVVEELFTYDRVEPKTVSIR